MHAEHEQQISVETISAYRCFQCFLSLNGHLDSSAHAIITGMDVAILPVKTLALAKSRLADVLAQEDHTALVGALLQDALDLCAGTPFLEWRVLTDDAEVADRARRRGLQVLSDAGGGLNHALAVAAAAVTAQGATSMTVIPVDVPLARPNDLQDLLDTGSVSDAVVVPSDRDGGTNGLYLSPPDLIEPAFGRSSLRAHLAIAEQRGYRCSILSLPRVALDIDTAEDLTTLVERGRNAETAALTVARRLVARAP